MIGTYLLGFVNSIMAALIAWNIVLTQTQMGAVDGVVNAGILFGTAVYAWYSNRKKPTAVTANKRSTVE